MLNVGDQAFVTVKIDGSPIEYAQIKDITIAEGNGVYAPTLKIELDDPTSLLAKSHAVSEGNPIEILIGKTMDDPNIKPRKFRVFGPSRDNSSWNPNIVIIGILDCPKYFTHSARECTTGTSADAIRAIASKVGLTFVGPDNGRVLNDKMTWWDVVTTRARNVQDITRHGYMDDKSCMESIVTSYHELRYKNLVDVINTPEGKIKYLFVHSTLQDPTTGTGKKCYIVKEARDRSSAGVMAHWQNYGSTRSSNHIEGVQKDRKEVDVKTPGAYLALNKEVTEMVKRTRFDYSEIDCTNTHKHYQDALYQNIKLLALFTETMSLLVTEVTDVQLFDPIIYRQADADPLSKVRNEDIYLVIGKTIVIRGGIHYAERLQCIRMSLTMKGQAQLATSMGSGDSSPSIIPESSITQSAIGAGNSNMPSVSRVSQALSPIGSIVSSLSSLTGSVASIAGPVMSQLANLQGLSSGNPSQILSALANLASPISSLLSQVNLLNGAAAGLPSATLGLINTLSSVSSGRNLTGAAISSNGSVLSAIASTVSMAVAYGNIGLQATNSVNGLGRTYSDSQQAREVLGTLGVVSSSLSSVSNATAGSWNSVVSALSGIALTPAMSAQLNSGQSSTGFLIRLTALMAYPGFNQQMLMQFLAQEASRTQAGSPNWMPNNALVPTVASMARDAATLSTIISNTGKK